MNIFGRGDKLWIVQDVTRPINMMISIVDKARQYVVQKDMKNISQMVDNFLNTSDVQINSTGIDRNIITYVFLHSQNLYYQLQDLLNPNYTVRVKRRTIIGFLNFYLHPLVLAKYSVLAHTYFEFVIPFRSFLSRTFLFPLEELFVGTQCPKFRCPAGWKKHYGKLLNSQTKYESFVLH